MSRWADHRRSEHRRAPHAFRQEVPAPGSPAGVDSRAPLEQQAVQVREALRQLGLGYSCLLLYLSSRIDLLPAEFCSEFALTPDISPPFPVDELQHTLEEEISPAMRGAITEFNLTPVHSSLLAHSYAARLANGAPVLVTILRPESSALRSGPELPPSFNKALVQEYCGKNVNDAVLLDFFAGLRRKCDFHAQANQLELLSHDRGICDVIRTRNVYRELCTGRILTCEQVDGRPITNVVGDGTQNTDALARSLSQVWLAQVLRGSSFAVDPQPDNIMLVDNGFLIAGCDFIALSPATKENLWNYFMAVMVDDPDKAALYLLREMWPAQRPKMDAETFRSKFRQSAYFGLLEPILGTNSNALPQLIFQHWKTALEYGYLPKPHLLCFYRGLFSIARIAQKLSPYGDPLREGMEEVRSDRILAQMTEMADWRYWFQNSDKFANAMVNLPKMLDDALTRTSTTNPASHVAENGSGRKNHGAADTTVLLLFLAVLLLFQSSNVNPLTEKLVMVLVLLGGLIALRKLSA